MASIDTLRLEPGDTAVLLVDFQERLFAAMPEGARERRRHQAGVLLRGAAELDLPVVVTEQYPKGLGPTVSELREARPDLKPVEKIHFSSCAEGPARDAIRATGRRTILVAGMETHVCVYQTVLDLRAMDYRVHLMGDACLSRRREHFESGLALCQQAGAVVSNVETALFQLLGRAGTDRFKAISKLVR